MNRFALRFGPAIHDLRTTDARRDRKTARHGLPDANDVRHHARVFAGEPTSRPTKPRVNFIEDQQQAVVVAEPAQLRKKIIRRHDNATAPLNRLHNDRAEILNVRHLRQTSKWNMRGEMTKLLSKKENESPRATSCRAHRR